MNLFQFIPGYEALIYDTGREPAFVMLVAFIITYILTRGYTRIARKTGWGSANFGGVHTHHMVFGLVMAFVAGALVFGFVPDTSGSFFLLLAALFGVGAALVLDEFALIFHLQDVYWEKEGRKSVDATVLGLLFACLFLLHATPFGTTGQDSGWLIFTLIVMYLPFVIIAALKGKLFMAIFGVFSPILAIIGAIRLAEPDSIWAHKFYKPKGKKITRSKKRYAAYEVKWRPRKEKLWDILGGKTGRPPKNKATTYCISCCDSVSDGSYFLARVLSSRKMTTNKVIQKKKMLKRKKTMKLCPFLRAMDAGKNTI